tara:strand:- start:296 stop:913 length:618 start_codon:yes stop_codon:yes gene_type:complete
MTLECKICGVSETETLKYIINHPFPPEFIGFIINYPKSKRFVKLDKLKKLIDINKKRSKFVAVLVKPNNEILENIKNLNFDYYQIYDCSPRKIKYIKLKYNKKIISAITVENKLDVNKYREFTPFSEIILFDSKGYDKSIGFNHNLLQNIPHSLKKMIAGNIKINDISNFKNKNYIIDLSGALENIAGKKNKNKINKFLMEVKKL